MRLKRIHREDPEVNMVPMIDCVFQLMIFFLIATQVKKDPPPVGLVLPVSRQAEPVKADELPPIIVNIVKPEVSKNAPYIVMGQMFDLAGFKKYLQERRLFYKQKRHDMPLLRVRADRDSQLKEIQQALIAARDVEIWQVRLTTRKVQQ
jgi:biopolymer transport protein ExbD